MNRSRFSGWKLPIAAFSLSLAISTYCFARINPPEILSPFISTSYALASYTGIFGSAPSFFYTLAVGLFIGLFTASRANARLHCSVWTGFCLLLEFTQLQTLSGAISNRLSDVIPELAWRYIGPYWQRGVFDHFDLLATLTGGVIALIMITYLPTEEIHDVNE